MSSDVMEKLVKLNSQSSGRDKIFRLLQYGSRFVWAHLEKYKYDRATIHKLKNLESALSTARKLYRLGRSIDIFYGALKTINLEDVTLRCTLTFSRINMALYFLADHMLWIDRVGLATIDKPKWSRISYKLWLYYLSMNLMRDIYEILRIVHQSSSSKYYLSRVIEPSTKSLVSRLYACYRSAVEHKDVTFDTIKNGFDILIPLAQLGYLNLSPRTIGILGVVSSIAGIIPLVDNNCKLSPM